MDFGLFGFGDANCPNSFCPNPPAYRVRETNYQTYFYQQLNQFFDENAGDQFKLIKENIGALTLRTSKNAYLDGIKPDISLFSQKHFDTAAMELSIVIVGVITSRDYDPSNDLKIFSNEAIGKVLTYSHRIFLANPTRPFVFSFITNCEKIQFFRTTPVPSSNSYSYVKTPAYRFADNGTRYLFQLLSAKLGDLGFNLPTWVLNFKPLAASEFLSEGKTSYVWKSKYNGHDVAVKEFKHDFLQVLNHESHVLRMCSHIGNIV